MFIYVNYGNNGKSDSYYLQSAYCVQGILYCVLYLIIIYNTLTHSFACKAQRD